MLRSLSRLIAGELKSLRGLVYRRLYERGGAGRRIADEFHKLYYDLPGDSWWNTRWLGVATQKCPLDLWVYQEIISELSPDLIIETGTAEGGSALFLASVCDMVGSGRVVSIDVEPGPGLPRHDRIEYLTGSSVSEATAVKVRAGAKDAAAVMVILDSDHSKAHVLDEMRLYGDLVTAGSYMIVEDTNLNGHPVHPGHGPGPMEAVEEFLRETDDFVVDETREKFKLTFNPKGYLRKK